MFLHLRLLNHNMPCSLICCILRWFVYLSNRLEYLDSFCLHFIRKAQHRGLVRMTSAGAMPPSPPDRSVSRDSQDSMEDYWSEMRNIEENCQGGQEEMMEKGSIDGECRADHATRTITSPRFHLAYHISTAFNMGFCFKNSWIWFIFIVLNLKCRYSRFGTVSA